MPNSIMAVDQVLTSLDSSSKIKEYYDYALSMVFANASARAASSSKPTSDRSAFLNSWMLQLGKLGWGIVESGQSSMSSSGPSDKETLADLIIAQSGTPSLRALFEQVALLEKQNGDEHKLTSDWWGHSVSSAGFLQMTVGGVSIGSGGPEFELTTLQLDLTQVKTHAARLFHKAESLKYETPSCLNEYVDPSSAPITIHNLKARLNMEVFSPLKPDIVTKLGDKFSEHCATYPDFKFD